ERARRPQTHARVTRSGRAADLVAGRRSRPLLETPVRQWRVAHDRGCVIVRLREQLTEATAHGPRGNPAGKGAVRVRPHDGETLPTLRREPLDRDAPGPSPGRPSPDVERLPLSVCDE